MGIYDRDWYRRSVGTARPRLPSVLKVLLIANVVCFLLQMIAQRSYGWDAAGEGLGLVPRDVVTKLKVWQLVTSMFLHGTPLHLFFNMFFLWMFGQYVELRLGPRPFLRFYFGAGICASLAYVILGILTNSGAGAIGASGAIMGVVVYYALLRPNDVIYLFFIIPMRMKWAALFFVGIDLYFFVFSSPGQTGIAHTAHLGGALFGFLYFRYAHRVARFLLDREIRAKSRAASRQRESRNDLQAEVDRLLEKIHASGMASLSEKEKRFLKEASERLRER